MQPFIIHVDARARSSFAVAYCNFQGRMGSRGGRPHSRCSKDKCLVSHQVFRGRKIGTYLGTRLGSEDLLDPLEDRGCQLGNHIEGLEVLDDLLGLGGTEDHCASGWFDGDPGERELRSCAAKFYDTAPMLESEHERKVNHATGERKRTFGDLRKLLDLCNLLETLLLVQTLERGLEEVRVVGEPRARGDAVVVLRRLSETNEGSCRESLSPCRSGGHLQARTTQ